ncbi:HetP family heterocyst commitment protein [Laspinema olomoucense]|uniref:HetP family heterocyst commitment protein n=1 Tax=Laspinema olomoucense TaxID=3231600 RepID=UPI0021BAAF3A|nr:HetP family heterocyst commitment protein [Laspinema sp. D3d]MCT7972487.1 HetP family heterocyst commitment protein [Laspinema sp. D3d]
MTYQMSYANNQLNKVMTQEQFDLVVEAILSGKYSWACVLILRFGGYNPLHYIPYRTYNRLMKEQRLGRTESGHRTNESDDEAELSPTLSVKNLAYVDILDKQR